MVRKSIKLLENLTVLPVSAIDSMLFISINKRFEMKSLHYILLACLSVLLLFSLLLSCGSEEGDINIVGTACTLDQDCGDVEYMCDVTNTCEKCTYCEARSDCPGANDTCNTDTNCCKQLLCTENSDCSDAKFCQEFVCRDMGCETSADCIRYEGDEALFCDAKVCAEKECIESSDCATKVCDTNIFKCKECFSDVDCPADYPQCTSGTCKEETQVDGDVIHNKMGCSEFKQGCMYDTFNCFDKIVPAGQSYSSCVKTTDDNDLPGFVFTFEDGSRWSSYGNPFSYHVAKGSDGCYYRMSLKLGFFEYTDKGGNLLGKFTYDLNNDLVQVICPDDTVENYSYKALHDDVCEGFQEGGIYTASTVGCQDAE